MSALETLRRKAEKIANDLANAENRALEEAAAVRARNRQRRTEFWQDAGERCNAARTAVREARAVVVDHAAAGDLPAAAAAYTEYAQRVVEAEVTVSLAKSATGSYRFTEVRQLNPDDRASMKTGKLHTPATELVQRQVLVTEWHRDEPMPPTNGTVEYPAGVANSVPAREPLEGLLAEGFEKFAASHRATYTAELLAPLRAVLEPEDDA